MVVGQDRPTFRQFIPLVVVVPDVMVLAVLVL
jgi:hypothetical protein